MNEVLEKAGIIPLTGESDSLGLRLLCDLTQQGCQIMNRFLGGNVTFEPDSNWNSGAVASVLIPYSCLRDLETFVKLTTAGKEDRNKHQFTGRTI